MASVKPHARGWRAQVYRHGVRRSRVTRTKAEADSWAVDTERAIDDRRAGRTPDASFADLLVRYRDEVSTAKRGARWETVRIDRIIRTDPLSAVRLGALDASHIAAWRDRRLREVSAASTRREWNMLSHACTIAVREWRWLPENPFRGVRRPAPSPARDRRITEHELERLLFALGYEPGVAPATQTARVGAALLFALETAMRAGEIAGLCWPQVDVSKRVATLLATKNGTQRQVPLFAGALAIIEQLRPVTADRPDGRVFGLASTQIIDALFRRAKARAQIDDLHFHDSRHEAITRLANKRDATGQRIFDVLALARVVGHRDLRQLMIYYNESAEDLARREG